MQNRLQIFLVVIFCYFGSNISAQRQYAANSVLSSGNWYKIGIVKEGVYKIDVSFLSQLGYNTNQLSSSSIRLYGNGGRQLPENNSVSRADDLFENAIEVYDGGDGVFNGNDYLLFYAPGPDNWKYDSVNMMFNHQKNLINDTCYYFLTINTNGKRIALNNNNLTPNTFVTHYDERLFHENDITTILNSGKNWFGEEFNNAQNRQSFNYNLSDILSSVSMKLRSNLLSRSIGTSSSFDISVNGQLVQNIPINGVSGNLIDNFAEQSSSISLISSPTSNCNISYTYNPASNSAQGWLDGFDLQYRRALQLNNQNQISFRDVSSVGNNNVAQFVLTGVNSNSEVWDVTDFTQPVKMNGIIIGNQFQFVNNAEVLREYIAFNKTQCLQPFKIGSITNQNLHQSEFADYLIIYPKLFVSQANRLAQFHTTQDNLIIKVAEAEQIYNEFGGGNKSAAAIRDFIKMYYDKAGSDSTEIPKYVLLFGIGNYDTKGRTASDINHIPCFESDNSINPVLSYTSDDFFALLSDTDNIINTIQPDVLKLSVGRLPVTSVDEANTVVDKIINYNKNETLGSWRNDLLFLADDKDANLFLNTSEQIINTVDDISKVVNYNKIYVDAYPLTRVFNTTTSPKVNQTIIDQLYSGKLIFNYSGHGNYQQLSSYSIFSNQDAKLLNNAKKLPLFVTSTCDFVPYDDPSKSSLGSYMLQGSKNGAIALLTTPRLVFAGDNQIVNENFLKTVLQKDQSGNYLSLGEAFHLSKNYTSQTISDVINIRKFSLIGDPALKLSFPKNNITIDSINEMSINNGDTIKSGNNYNITGFIRDNAGSVMSNFNGTVYAKVIDKPRAIRTLGNDPSSIATTFHQQTDLIYNGRATVQNGKFKFSFLVSKDVSSDIAKGKISLYAENGNEDASGFDTSFYIATNTLINNNDNAGPDIKLYLDDYHFKNGGNVDDRSLFLVRLTDSSGINTVFNSNIDHNIKVIIDGDETHPIILNSFYENDLDTYKSGGIAYQLPSLTEGAHTIKLMAWDNVGNSSTSTLNFNIIENSQFQIYNLINYPNPVSSNTNISFQINEPAQHLKVAINFYSLDGRLIDQTKKELTNTSRFIDFPCNVNFKKLSSGIYFYRVRIVNEKGEEVMTSQKMVKF
jgi:hypothetical protein